MDKEVELILSKLKIVSEEQERGMYLCDKEHSKMLLDYITNLQQENERLKEKSINEVLKKIEKLEDYKSRIEECKNAIDQIIGFQIDSHQTTEEKKIPEKLDVIAYEKCIHEVTHKEKQLALEIRETQIAFNEIIDYLKSKGE